MTGLCSSQNTHIYGLRSPFLAGCSLWCPQTITVISKITVYKSPYNIAIARITDITKTQSEKHGWKNDTYRLAWHKPSTCKKCMKLSVTIQDMPVFDDERLNTSPLRSGMKQKTRKHCWEN